MLMLHSGGLHVHSWHWTAHGVGRRPHATIILRDKTIKNVSNIEKPLMLFAEEKNNLCPPILDSSYLWAHGHSSRRVHSHWSAHIRMTCKNRHQHVNPHMSRLLKSGIKACHRQSSILIPLDVTSMALEAVICSLSEFCLYLTVFYSSPCGLVGSKLFGRRG